ncbi:MAG: 2Fe-2S iron-sulfur cluster binding domain-containing protein [Alphaproteobacteria bacterium]
MPLIHMTTRDNEQMKFDCAADQNLLDAAAAAKIFLPSQCRQGSCGVCLATVTSGDYELGEHDSKLLDSGVGSILMCRTKPLSDLKIALPYDRARILTHAPKWRMAEIVALETVAQDTMRLELQLPSDAEGGSVAEFEPGQFMELEIPGTEEHRAYSIANTPNWDGVFEFFIRLRTGGRFSTYLRSEGKIGDQIAMRGPFGAFGMDENSLRPAWFVAGGTGLAPLLSMLRRMAELQNMREVRLFFGVTYENELFAMDALERLKSDLLQFSTEFCVWRPSINWRGITGTPVKALSEALAATGAQPDLYVCGPGPLIDATFEVAKAAGIPREQVFSERF